MLYPENVTNELYQNLGKLFYAIAMADKQVKPKEVEALRKAVREQWLEVDDVEDEYGTDAAYQIEIVFDWLQNEENAGDAYFKDFQTFYKEHPQLFPKPINEKIVRTAQRIASSFAGTNKSELILLSKLQLLLEK